MKRAEATEKRRLARRAKDGASIEPKTEATPLLVQSPVRARVRIYSCAHIHTRAHTYADTHTHTHSCTDNRAHIHTTEVIVPHAH